MNLDADALQKRALMEEILDLQRRLDELTPILAQKESIIARLENEKDDLTVKMRGIQSENSHLQVSSCMVFVDRSSLM